jgi:hypothetical protein
MYYTPYGPKPTVVYLERNFEYGYRDIHHISWINASVLGNLGSSLVKRATEDIHLEIGTIPEDSETSKGELPSLEEFIIRQKAYTGCRHFNFRPSHITINRDSRNKGGQDLQDSSVSLALLEAIRWSKTGNLDPEDNTTILIESVNLKTVLLLAKAVSLLRSGLRFLQLSALV